MSVPRPTVFVVALCVAIMCFVGDAHAAKPSRATPTTWIEAMARGQQLHRSMDLEGALAQFERAATLTENVDEKVATKLWLGITHCELGSFKACDSAFLEALELDEHVALPKNVELPPKTRGIFEGARLKIEPPAPPVVEAPAEPIVEPDPTPLVLEETQPERVPETNAGPNWLLIGGGAVAGIAAVVVGGAVALDLAAGPRPLDGGLASNAGYGAGAVLFACGGAVAVASLLTSP